LSDTPTDASDSGHWSRAALHPLLASDALLPRETAIEWNVSESVDKARHVVYHEDLIARANEPATNLPTNTLTIELCFIDQPNVKWKWDPILIQKRRAIRVADVFLAIYDYFQTQITRSEWDAVKSYGKPNSRIVRDSWRERADSQSGEEARSIVYNGGLRRVDCLGSSRVFSGLWVDGSGLKLGLRA
jgi:hypothetical protein